MLEILPIQLWMKRVIFFLSVLFSPPSVCPRFTLDWIRKIASGEDACKLFLSQISLCHLNQFDQLQLEKFNLKLLDVTQAQADSYGQRQIVLTLEKHLVKKSHIQHNH